MEPKNIDRLFQEKLKDLELTPNPAVWNKIEASLAQKKKKKRVVIWLQYVGVAAIALLGIFIYNNSSNDTVIQLETIENTVTDTQVFKTEPTKKETLKNEPFLEEISSDQAPIVARENSVSAKKPILKENKKFKHESKIAIAENSQIEKTPEKTEIPVTDNSKTIFEELNNASAPTIDTENIAFHKNPKLIKKETKLDLATVVEEKKENKELVKTSWVLAPTISQLYSNTMSNKSSIDARLNDAHKTGNNSTSFGFKVAYRGSQKWQFQTGIHRLELAQTTHNIGLASTVDAASISNTNFDSKVSEALTSKDNGFGAPQDLLNDKEGTINQTYGYIEIPIEAKYALLQSKKLEFHLVGGLSTLFLTKNNVHVETNTFSYSAGEANNLNKVNFTLNFGSNLEYHFNQKWFFDIAPMVKFQTNTFETRSNKPYFFGIYTGFNYKF
jgi:hypothetical protein